MMGTGGGSPKDLQLSATEDALIKFLTPDASGLRDIPEGGFTDVMSSYDNNKTLSSSTSSYNIEEKQDDTEDIVSNDIMILFYFFVILFFKLYVQYMHMYV